MNAYILLSTFARYPLQYTLQEWFLIRRSLGLKRFQPRLGIDYPGFKRMEVHRFRIDMLRFSLLGRRHPADPWGGIIILICPDRLISVLLMMLRRPFAPDARMLLGSFC